MSSRRATFLPFLAALGALCCQPDPASEAPGSSPYLIYEETPQGAEIILEPDRPRRFREAPMLARLVAQGRLPPVEERLPENPLVLHPDASRAYLPPQPIHLPDDGGFNPHVHPVSGEWNHLPTTWV